MKIGRFVSSLIVCVSAVGLIFALSSCGPAKGKPTGASVSQKGKQPAPVASVPQKGKQPAPIASAKKGFAPGMGGLTVKVVNAKNAPVPVRIKAFFAVDQRSSIFRAIFPSNVMQELSAGTYDLQIDAVPPMIYRGVTVAAGRETVQNMGCLTGTLVVKAINAKQKPAAYPVRILYAGTKMAVTAVIANKPVEVGPGTYDIEVGMVPLLVKKDVKVEIAKEAVIDLGCMVGDLMVKVVDETGKEKRANVRVRKAGAGEVIVTGVSNKPLEIVEGRYDVEVGLLPVQSRKDVQVKAGAETAVEFVAAPQAKPAVGAASAKPQ